MPASSASQLALYTLALVGGFVGLYYGASFLVRGSVDIARKVGISSLVIGLTFVACGTSMPELVVSIQAALTGHVDISLGNIVGSNICNIALILGMSALITPLTVNKALLKFDAPVMILGTLLLALFYAITGGLNRVEALLLLVLFVAYILYTIRQAKREEATQKDVVSQEAPSAEPSEKLLAVPLALLLAIAGLGILVGASKLFVYGAVGFATWLEVSPAVIGLTIVAIGTSLPELATSVIAALHGERDIAIGNVVGSNIFNVFAILGIAPLFRPMLHSQISMFDLGTMLLLSVILLPLMLTGRRINRLEGAFLLILYGAYLAILIHTTL